MADIALKVKRLMVIEYQLWIHYRNKSFGSWDIMTVSVRDWKRAITE
jgi:hypothetical protein